MSIRTTIILETMDITLNAKNLMAINTIIHQIEIWWNPSPLSITILIHIFYIKLVKSRAHAHAQFSILTFLNIGTLFTTYIDYNVCISMSNERVFPIKIQDNNNWCSLLECWMQNDTIYLNDDNDGNSR